jgi:glycosyltransferase involved in cell wall biosynthesis
MTPSVSVIIPVYNRAETIVRSVDSVLAQTFLDFEIIIVDDGSTDQTRKIVQQMSDERIHLMCHDHNLGAAAARNTGMKVATGKYIAWLDSDDEWLTEKLKSQLEAFEQAVPDQRAGYTAYERIEKNGVLDYVPKQVDYKKLFLGCDLSPGSTLIFERTLLDDIGYIDTSLPRYEDWDWLLRYSAKYSLLPVNQPLARIHYTPRRSVDMIEVSARLFIAKYAQELRRFGVYRNVVISRRWMEVASYYAQEHQLHTMLQYICRALLLYPLQPVSVWAWLINSWFGIKIRDLL